MGVGSAVVIILPSENLARGGNEKRKEQKTKGGHCRHELLACLPLLLAKLSTRSARELPGG